MINSVNYNSINTYANQNINYRNQPQANTPVQTSSPTQAATVEISPQATAQQANAPMAATAVTSAASATPTSSNAHAIMVLARTHEIMQGRYVAAEGGRPSFFYGIGSQTDFFYDFARDHLGIQDSQARRDFGSEIIANMWTSDASVRQATLFAMEHLATSNISDVEESAQFLADFRTMAFAGQMFWEQGYIVRSHVRNDDGTITQQPHVRPISYDVSMWYVPGEHEAMRSERERITTLAFPIFFHHSPETFQEDWVNILANDGRQNAADAVQRLFDIANSGQAQIGQTPPSQANTQMAAMAVTNTASATSSQLIFGEVLGILNRTLQERTITPEMHGYADRPAFIDGVNFRTTAVYDFARDYLGMQDSTTRREFEQHIQSSLRGSDSGTRQATLLTMEHLAMTNFTNAQDAAMFLVEMETIASAGRMFWEEGYVVGRHIDMHDDGSFTINDARPMSVREFAPSFPLDDSDTIRADRHNVNSLLAPVNLHQNPDTFQTDIINLLQGDGRQNAANAIQNIFDMIGNAQAQTPPQAPPTSSEPPPIAPPPPSTPAPPPATNSNNPEQQLLATFGDIEMLTWSNMSQDSRDRLVNAFDVRLESHENRLQFQALFTYMSIQYNSDFRAAVNNGTLSFNGDLADRLARLGVQPATTEVPQTAPATEELTQSIQPQAIALEEGFPFNLNNRSLLEQRNAMLMEMFRNLNTNEDMDEDPIMQILAAHNLS